MDSNTSISLTKIDAARRQLRAAIRMWFTGEDEVAIYALAYAAHEVLHTLHIKAGGKHGLVFDSPVLTEVGQKAIKKGIKDWGNFLKHSDKDPDGTIALKPQITEIVMLASALTLHTLTGQFGAEEAALHFWVATHAPKGGFRIPPENEQFHERIRKEYPDKADFWAFMKIEWGNSVQWKGGYPKPDGF